MSTASIKSLRPSSIQTSNTVLPIVPETAEPIQGPSEENILGPSASLASPPSVQKVNQIKFWLWGLFAFFVTFALVALALGLAKPPVVQSTNTIGEPTGSINYAILFGAAASLRRRL